MKRKRPDAKAQAKRLALNALRRARRQAERAGVKLSDWEGDFLGSVETRLKTFGRRLEHPRMVVCRSGERRSATEPDVAAHIMGWTPPTFRPR